MSQLPALHEQHQWAGLRTVVMVVRSTQYWNQTIQEVQFYITSLASDANKIGSAIRQHWGIENSVHWTLDQASMRMNLGFVLCTVHRILLYYVALPDWALERESSFRRSLRQKSRRAAMNDQYMVSVLTAALPNSSPLQNPLVNRV